MNFYSKLPESHHLTCFSLWDLTCVTSSVQMAFPMFHEYDADGTIRINGKHWEGFPCLAWEALSVQAWALRRSLLQGDRHCATTLGPRATGLTWASSTRVFMGTSPSSQPPFGYWRTFATTTLQWWLSLRLGCFRLWVLTTRRGWIVWTTFKSCFC
jgi:hypothetical protein